MKRRQSIANPFICWIKETGVDNVAQILGVDRSTVSYWSRGKTIPRVEQMKLIKKVTKGRVSYEQIIDGAESKSGLPKGLNQ